MSETPTLAPAKKRGPKPKPIKPITVRVAVPPALYANLEILGNEFGYGTGVADVIRNIAIALVSRLQDEGRLPDRPMKSPEA